MVGKLLIHGTKPIFQITYKVMAVLLNSNLVCLLIFFETHIPSFRHNSNLLCHLLSYVLICLEILSDLKHFSAQKTIQLYRENSPGFNGSMKQERLGSAVSDPIWGKFWRIIEQSNSLAYWGPGDPLVIWHRHMDQNRCRNKHRG